MSKPEDYSDEESALAAAEHWLRTGSSNNSVRQQLMHKWPSLAWQAREDIIETARANVSKDGA